MPFLSTFGLARSHSDAHPVRHRLWSDEVVKALVKDIVCGFDDDKLLRRDIEIVDAGDHTRVSAEKHSFCLGRGERKLVRFGDPEHVQIISPCGVCSEPVIEAWCDTKNGRAVSCS